MRKGNRFVVVLEVRPSPLLVARSNLIVVAGFFGVSAPRSFQGNSIFAKRTGDALESGQPREATPTTFPRAGAPILDPLKVSTLDPETTWKPSADLALPSVRLKTPVPPKWVLEELGGYKADR